MSALGVFLILGAGAYLATVGMLFAYMLGIYHAERRDQG